MFIQSTQSFAQSRSSRQQTNPSATAVTSRPQSVKSASLLLIGSLLAPICGSGLIACSDDAASDRDSTTTHEVLGGGRPKASTPKTKTKQEEPPPAAERMLRIEESVIPTLFFSDGEGNVVTEDTPDDTIVYRALPGEPDMFQLTDTEEQPLTWGKARQATGQAEVHCDAAGSRIVIDARGLIPNGVYTGWLVFFGEPGFAEVGLSALLAVSPVGPTDGSESVFVASESGHGELVAMTPKAEATVPYAADVSIPQCLLDTFEVHVVLAYHQDGKTCGDNPCGDDTFVEHLAWVINEGHAYEPEARLMSFPTGPGERTAPHSCLKQPDGAEPGKLTPDGSATPMRDVSSGAVPMCRR